MDVKPTLGVPGSFPEAGWVNQYSPETVKPTPVETAKTENPTIREGQPTEKSAEQRKAEAEDVASILQKLNIVMNAMSIQARFEVHQPTKEIMVKVVNVESGQVIREIPPKKILDMVAQMQELVGLLLDERG